MNEHYTSIYEIPMRDADLQTHQYSTLSREWTNTRADLFKASRKRDKILLLLIVLQFICLSVAVASIVHFYEPHGSKDEKGSSGDLGVKTLDCDVGWNMFMISCYYFELESVKTWNDAKIDCHSKGGYLVKIDNAVENWFLKSYMQFDNKKGHVWIGANDNAQESNFVWESDNTSLTFTDWNTGEPNNKDTGEDCASMHLLWDYKWNDSACSLLYPYICEK